MLFSQTLHFVFDFKFRQIFGIQLFGQIAICHILNYHACKLYSFTFKDESENTSESFTLFIMEKYLFQNHVKLRIMIKCLLWLLNSKIYNETFDNAYISNKNSRISLTKILIIKVCGELPLPANLKILMI